MIDQSEISGYISSKIAMPRSKKVSYRRTTDNTRAPAASQPAPKPGVKHTPETPRETRASAKLNGQCGVHKVESTKVCFSAEQNTPTSPGKSYRDAASPSKTPVSTDLAVKSYLFTTVFEICQPEAIPDAEEHGWTHVTSREDRMAARAALANRSRKSPSSSPAVKVYCRNATEITSVAFDFDCFVSIRSASN